MAIHTVSTATTSVNGYGSYSDVLPGDIIELIPGVRGSLTISNIIGTVTQPITIRNGNGQSVIDTSSGWVGFWMTNCRYIHFTGSGYGQTYGIKFADCNGFGLLAEECTDNIEIDHIEGNDINGDGIFITVKTMATNGINRGTYVMRNVKVHDCHCDGGLGVNALTMFCYIGNSNYLEDSSQITLENIEIYDNLIENTYHKSLQVGSVVSNLKVHDNRILRGCMVAPSEGIGININAGIGAEVYNNWIQDTWGAGIYYQTAGGKVYNNVIVDCGRNQGTYGSGIVVDHRGVSHSQSLQILNNTIIRPLHYGVNFYDSYGTQTYQNNIIVAPGSGYHQGTPDVDSNNLETMDIDDPVFVNYAGDDYNLDTGSPAIDAGADISAFGITFDMNNNPRPVDDYDQGAYEMQVPATPPGIALNYGPSVWMDG